MPEMDAGDTDGPPGPSLSSVWVTLSVVEARLLFESLRLWAEDMDDGQDKPGWHIHITDDSGRELTVAVGEPDTPR